ncbi:MAG: hypothetical protein Q2306_01550 [Phytoplasma sp.]|uniref:hypothetical protein n=1 Tax=Phytoplasma sp. TaxID=2155 RepID=UPI002B40FC19|nr:hypothetical protein [Phytoplasma sp.]WRH06573.1 MAG: hypothetical protein Q2306_01550 [Phytoplasma sp.]
MIFQDKTKILKIFGPILLFIILSLVALFSVIYPEQSQDFIDKELLENSNPNFNDLSHGSHKSIDLTQVHNELQEIIQQQQKDIQSKEEEISFLNNLILNNDNYDDENNFQPKLDLFTLDKEKKDLENKINHLEISLTTSEQLNSVLKDKIIFLEQQLNDEFYLKDTQQE